MTFKGLWHPWMWVLCGMDHLHSRNDPFLLHFVLICPSSQVWHLAPSNTLLLFQSEILFCLGRFWHPFSQWVAPYSTITPIKFNRVAFDMVLFNIRVSHSDPFIGVSLISPNPVLQWCNSMALRGFMSWVYNKIRGESCILCVICWSF